MNYDHHPCFNPNACKNFGRVHLPVAPACNIQCNFCNRKFDCVNESRPGVSSAILSPDQAMAYLEDVMAARKNISVVGIAGPGDPFANPVQTLATLEKVRQAWPEMLLCVATNGLNLLPYLDDLARLRVSHVSITVNALDPEIGEKVYAWVRDQRRTLGPKAGARLLLERQTQAIQGLKERGIIVKVNTIVLPGINDGHIEAVAAGMAALRADLFNCMPYFPNDGANLSGLREPGPDTMKTLQKKAEAYLPQMRHCKRCRADAVGMLGEPADHRLMERLRTHAARPIPFPRNIPWGPGVPARESGAAALKAIPDSSAEKSRPPRPAGPNSIPRDRLMPYVAVATREGVLVNQHLGEAALMAIYDISRERPVLVEKRQMPRPGGRDFRWYGVARALSDCRIVLVSGIGTNPRQILENEGLEVMEVSGMIDTLLAALKTEKDISHLRVRERPALGQSCLGTGTGCM